MISVDHDLVDGPRHTLHRQLKDLIESGYGLGDATEEMEQAGADGALTRAGGGDASCPAIRAERQSLLGTSHIH